MRIKFRGEDLGEWNGQPTLAEARLIKAQLGMLPADFGQALEDADPDAFSMMVAIMMTRRNPLQPVAYDEIDGEYDDLDIELSAEEQKQVDEAMKRRGGKGPRLRSVPSAASKSDGAPATNGKPGSSKTSTARSGRAPSGSGNSTA